MTNKFIDTAQAGRLLNVSYHRVHTLIKRGYLKDHKPYNSEHKKHYALLDMSEVKEFKRNFVLGSRDVLPRTAPSGNGHHPERPSVEMPIPIPPTYLPIKPEAKTPVQSFNERLQAIEEKLDLLIKMWS